MIVHDGVEGHEHRARGILELLVHADAVVEWYPVLDAGQGGGPVAGPHLLDSHGQHGAGAAQRGQGGQVEGGGPSGARVVHVDDAGIAQPGLAQERLAPDASLVDQPAGGGVAEDHQM